MSFQGLQNCSLLVQKTKKAWSKEALNDLADIVDLCNDIFHQRITNVELATFLLKMYGKYDLDVEKIKEVKPFKSLLEV